MLRNYQMRTKSVIRVKYPMATQEDLPQRFLGSNSPVKNILFSCFLALYYWVYAISVHLFIEIPVFMIYVPRIVFLKFLSSDVQFEIMGVDINGQPKAFAHPPMVFLELKVIEILDKILPKGFIKKRSYFPEN